MGSNYSAGPFPDDVLCLVKLEIAEISGKINRFQRTLDRNFEDEIFITKKQFQYVFQLDDKQTFILFRRFDPDQTGRVPAVELWGGMALAANAVVIEKIDFIFSLMDKNRDKCLNEVDLYMVIRCATRGLAKLKNAKFPPDKTVRRVLTESMKMPRLRHPDTGEVILRELRSFLLSHDLPRTYFTNLGSMDTSQEADRLVSQRESLLNQILNLDAQIEEYQRANELTKEEKALFRAERGGDSRYIRLTESVFRSFQGKNKDNTDVEEELLEEIRVAAETQALRRQERQAIEVDRSLAMRAALRAREGAVEPVGDAEAFSYQKQREARALAEKVKQGALLDGADAEEKAAFREALRHRWQSLRPQSEDGLAALDLDSLEDLFEAAGVKLSDEEALSCLEYLEPHKSSIGRYPLQAVMDWFEASAWDRELLRARRVKGGSAVRIMDEVQRQLRTVVFPAVLDGVATFQKLYDSLMRQLVIVEEIHRSRERRKSPPANKGRAGLPGAVAGAGAGEEEDEREADSTAVPIDLSLKGSLAKSFWQKHQIAVKPGAKVNFSAKFGTDPEEAAVESDKREKHQVQKGGERGGAVGNADKNPKTLFAGKKLGISLGNSKSTRTLRSATSTVGEGGSGNSKSKGKQAATEKLLTPQEELMQRIRKAAEKAQLEKTKWKLRMNVEAGVLPPVASTGNFTSSNGGNSENLESKKGPPWVDPHSGILHSLSLLTPTALLENFRLGNPDMATDSNSPDDSADKQQKADDHDVNKIMSVLSSHADQLVAGVVGLDTLQALEQKNPDLLAPVFPPDSPERSGELRKGGTVTWFTFGVSPFASDYEAHCLLAVLRKFFESILYEQRHHWFSQIYAEMLYLPSDMAFKTQPAAPPDNGGGYTDGTESVASESVSDIDISKLGSIDKASVSVGSLPQVEGSVEDKTLRRQASTQPSVADSETGPQQRNPHPRHVLIALVHERDYWVELEDLLPETLLATRGLRGLNVELKMSPGLDTLFDISAFLQQAEERLFGPQEDELGEEAMNPLRFAKMCRQKQKLATDLSARAPKLSPDNLANELTSRGLSATGEREVLVTRLQRCLQEEVEMVGYGELSSFGMDMCRQIFERFDVDCDGALSLEEINLFLLQTGCATFLSEKEYKATVAEEGFHTNECGFLTEFGLRRYYLSWGRLWEDIRRMGFQCPNEQLFGEVTGTIEIDTVALGSLFSLLEEHPLAQTLLKRVLAGLSCLKESYWDGVFDSIRGIWGLGQVLERLGKDGIFAGTVFETVLQDILSCLLLPDGLASTLTKYSEWLADGEKGVLRMLRLAVNEKFRGFDDWATILKAAVADAPFAQADNQSSYDDFSLDMNLSRTTGAELPPEFETGSVRTEFGREKPGLSDRERAKLDAFFAQQLPPVLNTEKLSTTAIGALRHRVEDLRRKLRELLYTKNERDELTSKLTAMEAELKDLEDQRGRATDLFVVHMLTVYDATRLYGTGLTGMGVGTKEAYLKATMASLGSDNNPAWTWPQCLPEGLGELSTRRQLELEKRQRAEQRKKAAAAAMEREKLRRSMAADERDKLRRMKSENMQIARDEEEKQLFSEAYLARTAIRESQKSSVDIAKMVDKWRGLSTLRTSRYPNEVRAAVCQNNLACVLLEHYADNIHVVLEAQELFRSSAGAVMAHLEELGFGLGLLTVRPHDVPASRPGTGAKKEGTLKKGLSKAAIADSPTGGPAERDFEAAGVLEMARPDVVLPLGIPSFLLILLQNYITLLRNSGNTFDLMKSANVRYAIETLESMLTSRERDKLHLERLFDGIVVLVYKDVRDELRLLLEEVKSERGEAVQERDRMEREALLLMEREEEEKQRLEALRLEKLQKLRKQQEEAESLKQMKHKRDKGAEKLARAAVTEQRKKLYNMVSTNEISRLFNELADDAGQGKKPAQDIGEILNLK